MHIALYEPDIAQNTGTILRLCACLGVSAHIIEPAGFPVSDRTFRRAGMDYLDQVKLTRHMSWTAFEQWRRIEKLFGRESAGVPEAVHAAADTRLTIPMRPGLRSLNVAMACAMVVGEALRQIGETQVK
jgi:tRNA (cytidine/uridine-2'-O-)-methyltransferase